MPLSLSVNVSRLNFYNENMQTCLERLAEKYKLAPQLLRLEVTEGAYAENPQQIVEMSRVLRASGFRVLIDDFGRETSSLAMLRDFPVDFLKFDCGFLQGDGEEAARGRAILESLVPLAERLGTGIAVEGVETREQLTYLTSIGCRYIQGYVYAKPMPQEAFCQLLRQDGIEAPED